MNNYVANYRKVEVKKRTMLLLLLAAFGTFFDGASTIAGQAVGIEEYSPVVNAIGGLGVSLLVRVVALAVLYLIVQRLHRPRDVKIISIALRFYIVPVWVVAFLNAGVTLVVYLFY